MAVLLLALALLLAGQRGVRDAVEAEVLGVQFGAARGGGTATAPGQVRQQLTVSGGRVQGLAPGVPRTLVVGVRNPHQFRVVLTDVTVRVSAAASAGCPASLLSVGGLAAPVTIGRTGTVSVEVPIQLLPAAPDACKGAVFPLTIDVAAVKENQP